MRDGAKPAKSRKAKTAANPGKTREPKRRTVTPDFSPGWEGLGVKQLGSLVEAFEIAFQCARLGPERTLSDKLKQIGVSKEFFYARSKDFERFTGGTTLTDEIDKLCDTRPDHARHRRSDLFQEYEAIRRWYESLPKERHDTPRVRLGVSQALVRPLVSRILREYRDSYPAGEEPLVQVEIEYSRTLHKLFKDQRIDLFVSHPPPEGVPVHDQMPMAPSLWAFSFVCPHQHPAVRAVHELGEAKKLPWEAEALGGTTLILLSPHRDRSPQYVFHREFFIQKGLRVIEVPTFERAHDLVLCGGKSHACITVPEFLEEHRLRDLSLIPLDRFEGTPAITPVSLAVVRRSDVQNMSERLREAVERLADRLAAGLHHLSGAGKRPPFHDRLEGVRHVYYVRTKETPPDPTAAEPDGRGWAHSTLDLRVLGNGIVTGRHTVDAGREADTGRYRGEAQTFHILGHATAHGSRPDEWHLVWSGVSDDHEAYIASFVFNESEESKEGDVVGVWTGRRTTGPATAAAFQPSAGYMVLSLKKGNPELSTAGEPLARGHAGEVLAWVRDRVEAYQRLYPGYELDSPDHWEWQTPATRRPRVRRSDEHTALFEAIRSLPTAAYDSIAQLIQTLQSQAKGTDQSAKPKK